MKNLEKTNKKHQKRDMQEILSRSIVLNGPMGSGKTLISSELSLITGMKVLHLDVMRFLQTKELIEWQIEHEDDADELKRLKLMLSIREDFPKIRNFSDFGFDSGISKKFGFYFGVFGKYVYKKQFDNMLLEEVVKRIEEPCIIDMGGTMGVSLDEKAKSMLEILSKEDAKLVNENINYEYMGFDKIKNILGKFSNVIELKLPEDYKVKNDKASRGELNEVFIESGQYSSTATMSISTDGLTSTLDGKTEINMQKLDEIVNEICEFCATKTADMER